MKATKTVKVPKGWRKMRTGELRGFNYRWWSGSKWELANVELAKLAIIFDEARSGHYIIRRRAARKAGRK